MSEAAGLAVSSAETRLVELQGEHRRLRGVLSLKKARGAVQLLEVVTQELVVRSVYDSDPRVKALLSCKDKQGLGEAGLALRESS